MGMKRQRSQSVYTLQIWSISFILFSALVFLAQPPSHESVAQTIHITAKHDTDKSTHGDELVKCFLTTPHAHKNATYEPAEGIIEIHVHKQIAPKASTAFLDLVSSRHFDGNYIFRVVPGFIVQWGIESPQNGQSRTKFTKADIDPPPTHFDPRRANVRGTLNFAGGNSGTGQVYINKADNKHLDKEKGSLPFASLEDSSMKIIDAVYDKYEQGSGQVKAVNSNSVEQLFPNMSRIERCWIASISSTGR